MSFALVNSGIAKDKFIRYSSIAIFSLATLSAAAFWPGAAMAGDRAVVKGDVVNLRAAPTTGSAMVGRALQGESLDVLGKEGDWYRVSKNGSACWVAGWLVDIAQAQQGGSAAGQAVIKGDVVNLRAAPSTGGAIVGRALQGESLDMLGKEGDWYQVGRNGVTCWVAGWLVEIKQGIPSRGADPAPNPSGQASGSVEITANGVNIRSGPGTSYGILGRAGSGDTYQLLEKSGDWCKVALGSGSGWVYSQYAKISAAPAGDQGAGAGWAVVSESDVNIRTGPGTTYQVVSRASRGQRLMVADRSSDWYKVVLDNGNTGWVVSWLVDVDGNSAGEQPAGQSNSSSQSGTGGQSNPGGGAIVPVQPPAPAPTPQNNGGTGGANSSGDSKPGNSSPPQASPGPKSAALKAVTAKLEGGNTVITVETDKIPIKYSVNSLPGPDRLIIDLSGLQPGGVPGDISFSSPLASGVRVGWFGKNPDVTRVVVDLKSPAKYEKQLSSDGSRLRIVLSPRTGRSLAGVKIVLDPGHGGADPGASGPSGLKEKDVNLDISLRVAQYLKKQGAVVTLTRTVDTAVELLERPNFTVRSGSDLFVCIHSNANPNPTAGGTSTYFLRDPEQGNDQAKYEGMFLARALQSALTGNLGRRNIGVLQANYAVLTRSKVPAALVEVAFLTNPEEEKLLGDSGFRDRAASAIARGIADYLAGK